MPLSGDYDLYNSLVVQSMTYFGSFSHDTPSWIIPKGLNDESPSTGERVFSQVECSVLSHMVIGGTLDREGCP